MSAQPASDPTAAETELRLTGERTLLEISGPQRGNSPGGNLSGIASALVQLGLVEAAVAEQVLEDYGLALSLRGLGTPPHFRRLHRQHHNAAAPRPLDLPVLHLMGREVGLPQDPPHVTHVLISAVDTRVHVTYTGPLSWMGGGPRRGRSTPALLQPAQWTVRDDQGTTTNAHFSGGGGGGEWGGRWTTDQPLSPTTAWIEIDGVRLEFREPIPASDVRLEPVERGPSTVLDFLWQRLAQGEQHWHGPDTVEEVLTRLGLLTDQDAPTLHALAELREWPHRKRRLTAEVRSALPQRWRAWYDQKAPKGRSGSVPLLATTPTFDGVQACLHSLVSDKDGFNVQVLAQGVTTDLHPFDQRLSTTSLSWWAHDDLGTWYLGQLQPSESDAHTTTGVVTFTPPLHTKATTLSLQATTLRTRAVIDVSLPPWDRR